MYDPRLGRWLSTDALAAKYTSITPYGAMNNNPLLYSDIDGRDVIVYCWDDKSHSYKPILTIVIDKKIIDEHIYLPKEWIIYDPLLAKTIDLSWIKLGEGIDAFMVSIDAGAAFAGGATGGFSMVYINKGVDAGGFFTYRQFGVTSGLYIGAGFQAGIIEFNENNSKGAKLDRTTFEGKSQGISGGMLIYSDTYIECYTDGKYCTDPINPLTNSCGDVLYRGVLGGAAVGPVPEVKVGGAYFWTEATLLNDGFQFPPETEGEKYPEDRKGKTLPDNQPRPKPDEVERQHH